MKRIIARSWDWAGAERLFNAPTFLQVTLGPQIVTAVATQGDGSAQFVSAFKLSYQDLQQRWQFYTHFPQKNGETPTLVSASILVGNSNAKSVKKQYIRPFKATAVRFHPTAWAGLSMAMRVELYVCFSAFNWKAVEQYLATSSKFKCEDMMATIEVQEAFTAWTLGRGGSGAIYESPFKILTYNQGSVPMNYTFQAIQRRVVSGGGLLVKQLVCFHPTRGGFEKGQTCCVRKTSTAFTENGKWFDQERETKIL